MKLNKKAVDSSTLTLVMMVIFSVMLFLFFWLYLSGKLKTMVGG